MPMYRIKKEIFYFIISGLVSTILSFLIFNILLHIFLDTSISLRYAAYFTGASLGYIVNSAYTFGRPKSVGRFFKYQLGYLPSYIVGEIATAKTVPLVTDNVQFFFVLLITAVTNYLILKYFVFSYS